MTDDERELLLLNSTMVVALLRDKYGENLADMRDMPEIRDKLDGANDVLLDHAARMLALASKVKEPSVAHIDTNEMIPIFREGLLETVRKEIKEGMGIFTDPEEQRTAEETLEKLK